MSRNKLIDKKKLIEKLHQMPIVEVGCKQIGLSRATYYRWRKDDIDFADACDEAIKQSSDKVNDLAESQLINAIKQQNLTAIMFWLKHHHRTYRNRLEVDARIQTTKQALTPEQAEVVAKALKLSGLIKTKEDNSDE